MLFELVHHAPPMEALLGGAFIAAGTAAFKLLRDAVKPTDVSTPAAMPETITTSTAEPPTDPTPPPPEPRPPPAEPTPPPAEPTPPGVEAAEPELF
ncbi:MAG TPA: hypothetical protein VK680_05605 [Solirubrobacteraceae bacterium]|nr:hypothetical protein [Solirubrobacteraceae bacterium]